MVNVNDLDELNKLGFGADVDKLESYTLHLKECNVIGVEYIDMDEYTRCTALLKKLKPESILFIGNWEDECGEITQYDKLLMEKSMRPLQLINGMDKLDVLREHISEVNCMDENETVELCAFARYVGIEVRAVYSMGYLVSSSIQSKFLKGSDITDIIKRSSIPTYVEDWKRIKLVEIRGIITTSKDKFSDVENEFVNESHVVMSILRADSADEDIKALDFVFNEIIISDDEKYKLNMGLTRGEVKDYLDDIGFMTPECIVMKDIDYYNFDNSIQQIMDYFYDLDSKDDLGYEYTGIDIVINNLNIAGQLGYRKDGVTLGVSRSGSSKVYEAQFIGIDWEVGIEYMQPFIMIERTITMNGDAVDRIKADNILDIEKYNVGDTVYFIYSKDGEALMCSEHV